MTYYNGDKIITRRQAIERLVERDGYACMYPTCDRDFDDDGHTLTIDHIFPQSPARAAGWTYEMINDFSNLQLMGKSCNAKKGDLVPDENGYFPVKEPGKQNNNHRPEVCETCMSGRLLLEDETCPDCGSGPQPYTWPRYRQKSPKECDHRIYHCWMCVLGHIDRIPAFEDALVGGIGE